MKVTLYHDKVYNRSKKLIFGKQITFAKIRRGSFYAQKG